MEHHEYSFSSTSFPVSNLEIARSIGYSEENVPAHFESIIKLVLGDLYKHAEPSGGFVVSRDISLKSSSIEIEGINFKTKNIITNGLGDAGSVAIFVTTIGENISRWIKNMLNDEAVIGYIADVAASIMTEKVVDKIQQLIIHYADSKMNCHTSNRYSPGYCGWSVADQHNLFSLLPEKFCGVSLNKDALMHPIKSVSGIVGIGKGLIEKPYPCNNCDIKDCIISPQY